MFYFIKTKRLQIFVLCVVHFLFLEFAPSIWANTFPEIKYPSLVDREVFHVTSDADSGPGSLRYILENILSDDIKERGQNYTIESVIYFDVPGGVIRPKLTFPQITKNINFIGPISFDLSEIVTETFSPYTFFPINQVNCVFHKIHFQNGQGNVRPISYIGGTGVFIDCIFSNNKVNTYGGAVYQASARRDNLGWSSLVFIHCSFIENATKSGGGAIFSLGNLSLIGCRFENNSTGPLQENPLSGQSSVSKEILQRRRRYGGGAVSGECINAIDCTFKNNHVVYIQEKDAVFSNDIRTETTSTIFFPPVHRWEWNYMDPFIQWGYGNETIEASKILNINNCTLIEGKN